MFWPRHQLLRLHPCELGKRPIGGFIPPDPLAWRKHWITAIALFIIAIVLIAMNDHLIANFPSGDFFTDSPDNSGGVRASNMVLCLMDIKRADRHPKTRPNTIIIDPGCHHQNQNILTVQRRRLYHFDLKRMVGLSVALTPNGPSIPRSRKGLFPARYRAQFQV
jgi:hypothetical protein